MGRPISGKHAIEVVVFVATFEKSFSANILEALLTLKESLKEKYPTFSETKVINVQIESKGLGKQNNSLAGVSLQKTGDGGKPEWLLRVERNEIVVFCYNYDRWASTSTKAIKDLTHVMTIVADDRNPVKNLALQTVDRFVGTPKESYKINKVFNSRSKYLTRNILNTGPLWHIHQGWFEETDTTRKLNILNLSTNDTPSGITTTIEHIARYLFRAPRSMKEVIQETFLSDTFTDLHEGNKEIVKDLLNKKQCRAIKLCP